MMLQTSIDMSETYLNGFLPTKHIQHYEQRLHNHFRVTGLIYLSNILLSIAQNNKEVKC